MRVISTLCFLLCPLVVQAQLLQLPDSELSQVDGGAGVGLVLANFKLDARDLRVVINDINNASGGNLPIKADRLYISGVGSKKGTALNAVDIGRLPYPINLNLAKGEDLRSFVNGSQIQTTPTGVTVAELAMPTQLSGAEGAQPCLPGVGINSCSSRRSERFDAGVRFEFKLNNGRTDVFTIDLADTALDGSYLRVWGNGVKDQMVGEARLNLFSKAVDVMSCKAGGPNCSTAGGRNDRTIYFTDVNASVGLGYGKSQPLLFNVTSDGQFVLELPNPVRGLGNPGNSVDTTSGEGLQRANDFYANAPRTNIMVGNFNSGGSRSSSTSTPSNGFNFGTNEIAGLRFNYLKVTSRGL